MIAAVQRMCVTNEIIFIVNFMSVLHTYVYQTHFTEIPVNNMNLTSQSSKKIYSDLRNIELCWFLEC
jgi:hypothetical protein